jgi:uncharacterized RDD family membrane protein YckC
MQDLPYASRSNRLIGQIIDSFIGAGPLIVAAIFSSFSDTLGTIFFIVAIAWSIFYYFFCDGFTGGQSFGKRILDMHVIDAKARTPCGYGQSFVRNLLLAILGPIDWIFIFGERHQRLGDMIAGTVVITEQR